MTFGRIAKLGALAALAMGAGIDRPARAAYVITMSQEGANVVATGSGSLDLTSFSFEGSIDYYGGLYPLLGEIGIGGTSGTQGDFYANGTFAGPSGFGPGGVNYPNSSTGPSVLLSIGAGDFLVPHGYVSGAPLGSSTDTFDNATYATLGVTPGTYTWTWGSGATADSLTLDVPEPASIALLATGLGVLGVGRRRRRIAGGLRTVI